jgi:hypothetical protein
MYSRAQMNASLRSPSLRATYSKVRAKSESRVGAPASMPGPPHSSIILNYRSIELTARFIVGFLQNQGFVVSEAAAARITAHVALLLAVRHQFILEGLEALHMSDYNLLDD